jgi:hypothetical protein
MPKKQQQSGDSAAPPSCDKPAEALQPISLEAIEHIEGGESLKEDLKKRLVLSAVSVMPSIPRAAKAAGVHPMTVYAWLGRLSHRQNMYDPVFARAFDLCLEFGVLNLEAVAQERALAYSDKLLMFLLKAYKRDVFGDADPDDDESKRKPVNVSITLHKPQ